VAAVALSHATMVALMSMTPVHLREHGASLTIVGFTISLHIAGMYASPLLFFEPRFWCRIGVCWPVGPGTVASLCR
jgi:hypothetical protein